MYTLSLRYLNTATGEERLEAWTYLRESTARADLALALAERAGNSRVLWSLSEREVVIDLGCT